jgi:hypothetical protein
VFSPSQVAAVHAAFALAGYEGELVTMPVTEPGELVFILGQEDVLRIDVVLLEQVVAQLLHRKVWVLSSVEESTVPFG